MRVALTALVALLALPAAADEREAGYELRLEPRAVEARPGVEGAVSLTIAPHAGYSIDRDGPLLVRVSVEPGEGLELPRAHYRRADAADALAEAPRFDLRYRPVTAGDYSLRIEARFWVCRRYTCRGAHETRQVAIHVTEPPPPSPPADASPPQ